MRRQNKVIISCAVTGSVHTPTMSPALPITPDEIAAEAVAASRAGAAVVHLHARDPKTGYPSPDPQLFKEFLPIIKTSCDAIVNITTGGSFRMTIEERLAAALWARPELASLNMGSMNFSFAGAAKGIETWQHEWERDYLLGSDGVIFANTFSQIERTLVELGQGAGTRFEYECYDLGHLYNLAHMADKGLIQSPMLIQAIFGVVGGMGADLDNLAHVISIADKLFGQDYLLSAFGAGRHQMTFATGSALNGGHVRVGLEDSLMISRGRLASGNAEQVEKIARIVREMGREVATPDEAREMLDLKGGDLVAF